MSPVTIPALTTIVDRQFKEYSTLRPVRALRYYLDRTKDLKGFRSLPFISFKKGHTSVSVDQIMQACHWKTRNTFTNFYLKDLTWSDNDNNMFLGPVVAAQQVLDPSPQTSHPRKEKGGGGTSATVKSSGV